jgi:hypothetical protein
VRSATGVTSRDTSSTRTGSRAAARGGAILQV